MAEAAEEALESRRTDGSDLLSASPSPFGSSRAPSTWRGEEEEEEEEEEEAEAALDVERQVAPPAARRDLAAAELSRAASVDQLFQVGDHSE